MVVRSEEQVPGSGAHRVRAHEVRETNRDRSSFQKLTQSRWLRQAVKFLAVGVLNTAIDAGLYLALTRWLGFGDRAVLAKGLSYSVGMINSFYWNRRWTFRSDVGVTRGLALFVLSNLVGLAINAAVMHLCLNVVGVPEFLPLILATAAAFCWNFYASKFMIFRPRPASGARPNARVR